MRYVISDVHGCYREYRKLLEKIRFSDRDELYVLGDAMDRGEEPIKVIQDMMSRPNVTYILGNHDYMMFQVISKLMVEITEENCEGYLTEENMMDYMYWLQDGGEVTKEQFIKLSREEQEQILEYLADAFVYEIVEDRGKKYILVHAGIHGFTEEKELDEYQIADFIFYRTDYRKRYYKEKNIYVITGHTPTPVFREDGLPEIYEGNGNIAIDCGCVSGGRLAAYCIDTGQCFYVDRKSRLADETGECDHELSETRKISVHDLKAQTGGDRNHSG